jgi:hypothetical protein
MEPQTRRILRNVNYSALSLFLAGMAAGLGVLLRTMTRAHRQEADADMQRSLAAMACLAAGMLAVTLIALGLVLLRWLRYRMQASREDHTTRAPGYIDAWSEAGKRIEAPAPEQLEDENEGDEGEAPENLWRG